MKISLFAILASFSLAISAQGTDNIVRKSDQTKENSIDLRLQDLERRIDAYDSARLDFAKGVADYESNPQMKKVVCAGINGTLPNALTRIRAIGAEVGKQRARMSEAQAARFAMSERRLQSASPELPACTGK